MKWSQLDHNQVHTDFVSWKTFRLLYSKAHINFIAGFWSWLGRYHEQQVSFLAIFHTYLEIAM
jgi:hypothetical protein